MNLNYFIIYIPKPNKPVNVIRLYRKKNYLITSKVGIPASARVLFFVFLLDFKCRLYYNKLKIYLKNPIFKF